MPATCLQQWFLPMPKSIDTASDTVDPVTSFVVPSAVPLPPITYGTLTQYKASKEVKEYKKMVKINKELQQSSTEYFEIAKHDYVLVKTQRGANTSTAWWLGISQMQYQQAPKTNENEDEIISVQWMAPFYFAPYQRWIDMGITDPQHTTPEDNDFNVGFKPWFKPFQRGDKRKNTKYLQDVPRNSVALILRKGDRKGDDASPFFNNGGLKPWAKREIAGLQIGYLLDKGLLRYTQPKAEDSARDREI